MSGSMEFPAGVVMGGGNSALEFVTVENSAAHAKIFLHGGHVAEFTPRGGRPILWMSAKSELAPGKPIRGGVPVCWPWFGAAAQPGLPSHGVARIADWRLVSAVRLGEAATRLVLQLTDREAPAAGFPFRLELAVTVGRALELALTMENRSDKPRRISGALHTYFAVSQIADVWIRGLENAPFINTVPGASPVEGNLEHDRIRFTGETDRIYLDNSSTVEIGDQGWGRLIRIEKSGSLSTVVWNPWIDKARRMADFGDDEYQEMVCVEAANARTDGRILEPGVPHTLVQKIFLA